MNNVNATIAQAISGFVPPDPRFEEYRSALASFDWLFEFSDDPDTRRRAHAALNHLHRLQAQIDPTGEIWNEYRPDHYGCPAAIIYKG